MEQKDYRLAAIMYTDIVGFSRMMEDDEAGTLQILHLHNDLVRKAVERRHGTVIKTIGDAFLVDFRNTVEALQCALEVQEELYAYNLEHRDLPLLLRIGVHLGDIYFFENDALGEGINIAARLQSLSCPGGICFSQDVYNHVLNKIDFRAEKLGKVSLKNITKEIHAYQICTSNVEFDPKRNAPGQPAGTKAPIAAPEPAAPTGTAAAAGLPLPGGADREYTQEASRDILEKIRLAILEDTRKFGRRMTVEEALDRYGEYGVEAREVIASMAERGILVKRGRQTTVLGLDQDKVTDIGRNIERAVHGIVDAIETRVQTQGQYGRGRDMRDYRQVGRETRHAVKAELRAALGQRDDDVATGKWDKDLKDSEYFKPGAEELETDFGRYRSKMGDKARKTVGGLVGNIVSFLGVNALLWYINLNFAPGFLWAAIVSASWGIGVASNLVAAIRSGARSREVERMPELDAGQLEVYKKLNRVKDSILSHGTSTLTVPALLATINLLTSPGFLWFLIPSGIMIASFLAHLASYPFTKKSLERKLLALLGADSWREVFTMGKRRAKAGKMSGPYASYYMEAAATRDAIVAQLKRFGKGDSPFGEDMTPTLDKYVDQVRLLTAAVNEIDGIVASIPSVDLRKDHDELVLKRDMAASPSMKSEYQRSIDEIVKQESGFRELEDQREVLKLRLRSSVNTLKQMQLDMARYKTMSDSESHVAVDDIRKKTDDLTNYLSDLKKGMDETGEDEKWKDIERLAAEADEAAKAERKSLENRTGETKTG